MHKWRNDIATWRANGTLFMSIVFTWDLPRAKEIATAHGDRKKVIAGGPAVMLMPDYLQGVATIRETTPFPALSMFNPMAAFTTRGCVNQCSFCAVPRTEGAFRELDHFEVRPLICDNNLSAASKKHFDRVIDCLKQAGFPAVDINQGLDARLFTNHHASRLAELKGIKIRFAFDSVANEKEVVRAIERARRHGLNDITCYAICGHGDTVEETLYRLELLRSLDVPSFPQRYQPLYCLNKNEHVSDVGGWTDEILKKVTTYYSRLNSAVTYYGRIPFDAWENHCCETGEMKKRFGLKKGKKIGLEQTIPLNLRQQAGAAYTADRKRKKTLAKLVKAFKSIEKLGKTPTQSAIANKAGCSERTVREYWHKLKEAETR